MKLIVRNLLEDFNLNYNLYQNKAMKELDIMVQDLKNYLDSKESKLKENPNFNAYTQGYLKLRLKDVESFQHACENFEPNPFLKNQIIDNFKYEAARIKSEIDEISIK